MDQDHQDRIRQRAHEIWESEGRPEGRDADHWSRAEEELRSQEGNDKSDEQSSEPQAQATPPAKPKRTTRKSTKAKAEPTPYLNDGP